MVASGRASAELVAAYDEVQAMRRAAREGDPLPSKPPSFVVEHRENVKRAQTRVRVQRFREKRRNAEVPESAEKCVTGAEGGGE